MKEIKFRAWDEINKYWIYLILEKGANFFPNSQWEGMNLSNWLQFTGLKDKNGIEIYEGDICEFESEPYYDENNKKCTNIYIREIMFQGARATPVNAYPSTNTKVIGNIYENTELLKGETK